MVMIDFLLILLVFVLGFGVGIGFERFYLSEVGRRKEFKKNHVLRDCAEGDY